MGEFGPTALFTSIIKTPNVDMSFGKNGVHPSSRAQRLVESVPRCTEAVFVALLGYNVGFSIHFSPVCSSQVTITREGDNNHAHAQTIPAHANIHKQFYLKACRE